MGLYARNKILTSFTIEKFISEYENAYNKVINTETLTTEIPELFELESHQEAS
jgi:hypothetical protein